MVIKDSEPQKATPPPPPPAPFELTYHFDERTKVHEAQVAVNAITVRANLDFLDMVKHRGASKEISDVLLADDDHCLLGEPVICCLQPKNKLMI